eukprot:GGOE01044506.1.p1 GENE.GGOE01044506.1~~GGOE01044506.1.p1  ORF type:complete len:296 (-),score=132.41 GGOE01044506.1:503-1330(-)
MAHAGYLAADTTLSASSNGGQGLSDAASVMSSSPSRALNAKRMRMVAENDVQFLANRIAKLKAEESKAKKEIEKTVKRTNEILSSRSVFENRSVDQLQIKEQLVNSKKEEKVVMTLSREKQLKAIWVAKQKLLNDKKELCQNMRKEKEINECRVLMMREEDRGKNMKRREEVKEQQLYAKVKREREVQQKQEEARVRYEETLAREEEEREQKEKLATELVQQEAQYIYRLKRLHEEKQKALRDLAAAVDAAHPEIIEEDLPDEKEDEPQEVDEEI